MANQFASIYDRVEQGEITMSDAVEILRKIGSKAAEREALCIAIGTLQAAAIEVSKTIAAATNPDASAQAKRLLTDAYCSLMSSTQLFKSSRASLQDVARATKECAEWRAIWAVSEAVNGS